MCTARAHQIRILAKSAQGIRNLNCSAIPILTCHDRNQQLKSSGKLGVLRFQDFERSAMFREEAEINGMLCTLVRSNVQSLHDLMSFSRHSEKGGTSRTVITTSSIPFASHFMTNFHPHIFPPVAPSSESLSSFGFPISHPIDFKRATKQLPHFKVNAPAINFYANSLRPRPRLQKKRASSVRWRHPFI